MSANKRDNKKYLFVIPTLSMGGAERIVSVLGNALYSNGRDVTVIKYYSCPDEYDTVPGVKIINLSGGSRNAYDGMSYFQKIRRLRSAIVSEKPDFIVPFLFQVARDVYLATQGLAVLVLQSIRIDPASGPASTYKRKFRDWLVYRSPCTFVQNERQRAYFKKNKDRIHVLYNPVSDSILQVEPAYPEQVFTICAAGRLEYQKNFPLLIDAFCRAFPKEGEAVLNIYGTGSQAASLERIVKERKRTGSIRLMGRTDRLAEVYRNCDLFVLSSDFEGMPNALIEAMACGLPCVSTDCPTGPSDLIDNGKNGLLVPVRDPEAMADAILRMCRDRDTAHAMGREAKETIRQKCDAGNIARKMISICEGIKSKN